MFPDKCRRPTHVAHLFPLALLTQQDNVTLGKIKCQATSLAGSHTRGVADRLYFLMRI